MKTLMLLTLLGTVLQDTTAVPHSLKYFYTGSSGVPNFPEFVAVGLVDDVEMIHYDSNTRTAEPKQDWMNRASEGEADYWQWQTDLAVGQQQSFKSNIEIVKQRFNQTGGIHLYQQMYGCEWDDETQEVNGYEQYGYDGEDFIAFDLKTETWIAPTPQAVISKHKWDNNKAFIAQKKNYFTQICPEWLKKYVDYGRSSLMRTDLPSVSLLQKTSSSPVSCHATGLYPNSAVMFWRKDGEELYEGVDHGEILPNHDGSFQMSVELKLPSESSADWGKYECVFQLSGVKEDIVTKLDKVAIRTNEGNSMHVTIGIIAAVLVLALALIAAVVFMLKKRNGERPKQKHEVILFSVFSFSTFFLSSLQK
uniref:major histocompatibility complex class I-related gene protein-like n=1 Tax=Semicossyphus pulcher TaxID=241346 RepID=UPI0037E9B1D4